MYKAREEMVKRFQRNTTKVELYLKILDHCWDSQLHKNLHASGYWLNPAYRYNKEEFEQHMTTTTGLLDVIERYAHKDSQLRTSEKRIYNNAELDFGRQAALDEQNTIMPSNFHNL